MARYARKFGLPSARSFRERCRKNVIYDFATCRRGGRRKWVINETIARRRSGPPARFSRNYVVICNICNCKSYTWRAFMSYLFIARNCARGERGSHCHRSKQRVIVSLISAVPSSSLILVMQESASFYQKSIRIFFWGIRISTFALSLSIRRRALSFSLASFSFALSSA